MSEQRVTIWGDIAGRYLITESGPDGRVVLEPDLSDAPEEGPTITEQVEQAAGQGRASLAAFFASLEISADVLVELELAARRNDEVALAFAKWARTNILGSA